MSERPLRVLISHGHRTLPGLGGGGAESGLRDQMLGLKRVGVECAWLASGQIEQAVREYKPDLLHFGTVHETPGLGVVRWAVAHSFPSVWQLHDYWSVCPGLPWRGCTSRMMLHNQDESCVGVEGVCQEGIERRAEWIQLVNSTYVTVGNEHSAAILRRHGVRVDAAVECGVDVEQFRPDPAALGWLNGRLPSPSVVASTAWGLAPVKGMRYLDLAARLGGFKAALLTRLTREQVALALRRHSIYVCPSTYEETWCLALTEAMASGLACIASDVAGLRAQIDDGQTGLLVAPRHPEGIAAAVRWLTEHPQEIVRLGRAARRHVEADHSLEAMGRRWLAVYRRVLDGTRPLLPSRSTEQEVPACS